MTEVSPPRFFERYELQESPILRFRHHPQKSTFDLVVDYAAEVVSSWFEHLMNRDSSDSEYSRPPRHFLWLRFTDVTSVSCQLRDASGDEAWREYEKKLIEKPVVISGVLFKQRAADFLLRLALQRHGWHAVSFGGLSIEERFGNAIEVGNGEWEYRDTVTGASIIFENPFPAVDI